MGRGCHRVLATGWVVSSSPRISCCRRRRYVSAAAKSLDTALTPTLRPSSQCVAAPPRAATSSARTLSGAAASSSTRPHSRSPPRYAPPGPRASSSAKVRTPPRRMAQAWAPGGDTEARVEDRRRSRPPGALQASWVSALFLAAPGDPGAFSRPCELVQGPRALGGLLVLRVRPVTRLGHRGRATFLPALLTLPPPSARRALFL